jgi:hypothetical protein
MAEPVSYGERKNDELVGTAPIGVAARTLLTASALPCASILAGPCNRASGALLLSPAQEHARISGAELCFAR